MSASLAPECNEVKEKYDTCFLKWYSESTILVQLYTASSTSGLTLLQNIFGGTPQRTSVNHFSSNTSPVYRYALELRFRAIDQLIIQQKALKDKGVDTMLAEARENTVPETDAEHMRR
ncbi:hypothetical protein EDD37DRAFT_669283 [Exophiala viscosa]|uniref:Uncharacterized protein n=1 Tax=Exophiala viscosa TaxID=2486360 RepID=A0AAN6DN59_9EURO|nr:hypothetical protein EDD36DRAFT_469304 [Exophiala viscosa]KAI1620367.1 hypothetical protein EDD37DRAFT_669283 [Exophiala viscosa]